ncbi:MAG TPA: hypothetical protein ENI81_01465 [Phycisphaerales bacterium]|nr:hypothetical protein [Phycisphaerales bacterium]
MHRTRQQYGHIQNKAWSRKKRAQCVILVTFILMLLMFFLWINTGEKKLIWESAYRVLVPEDRAVSGRFYSTGSGRYLLVLTSPSSNRREGYCINIDTHQIGMPSFSQSSYIALRRSALVDSETLEGYPYYGAIEADWQVASDQQEVRIRIKGFDTDALQSIHPSRDPNDIARFASECMPMAWEREIVLVEE